MAARIRLEIVTPTRRLIDAEVDEVRLPAALGEMGVLPGHTPLLTSLSTGPLAYTDSDGEHLLAVSKGFAEVADDNVTVLANQAERPDEIDVAAARSSVAEIEKKLGAATAEELEELTSALRRAETQLEVAGAGEA